jgi:chromate transporter
VTERVDVAPAEEAVETSRITPPGISGLIPWGMFLDAWTRVAAMSFGGPAGQIAVMHRIIVDERKWVREDRFLHALNYCMLLPGPEAQQLSVYLGWLQRGPLGGFVAGMLFILPGFVSILALSLLYTEYGHTSAVSGLFYGLKAAVIALVADAVWRIGGRSLRSVATRTIAVVAFVSTLLFAAPFPAIVAVAAILGYFGSRLWPGQFKIKSSHGDTHENAPEPYSLPGAAVAPTYRRTIGVLALGLVVWWGPVLAILAATGTKSVWSEQAILFSKAAMLTFGGAYSVLGYVAHEAVETYGWLKPPEMLDGLAMAESTPGPLIQVVQFVGYLGAYRQPGNLSPLTAGVLGSLITTWVTFAPCFLWIFLGAPYVERLRDAKSINAALSAITAAVVGVIASLGVWLAVHTLFALTRRVEWGPLTFDAPELATIDPLATIMAIVAFFVIRSRRAPILAVLGACAVVGWAVSVI